MSKHGTTLTFGQFAELSAAVIKALPRDIAADVALGWANNGEALSQALRGALCPSNQAAGKPKVLQARDLVTIGPLTQAFDPAKFFVTRKGLWVSDQFTRLVLPMAKIAEPTGVVSLQSYDLVRSAYDRDIKAEMPHNHEVALWVIAKMIEAQEGGKSGPLLNDDYWNIFYIAGFVVFVYWYAYYREWSVIAWHLDDDRWSARCRAFSSNVTFFSRIKAMREFLIQQNHLLGDSAESPMGRFKPLFPAANHSPQVVDLFGESRVTFSVECAQLPYNPHQKFQYIGFSKCGFDSG